MDHIVSESISPSHVARIAVTLGWPTERLDAMRVLPAGWHLAFCGTTLPKAALAGDGLARNDPFLPAIEGFPARVMGATSTRFLSPIPIGAQLTCMSRPVGLHEKIGRSGPLRVLTIGRRYLVGDVLAISEEQEVVYLPGPPARPAAGPIPAAPAGHREGDRQEDGDWEETIELDEIDVFRFSAVTFNSHRIHYDQAYAVGAEGWPGLLVQAKLIALHLLAAFERARGASPRRFAFRSVAPLACPARVTLRIGRPSAAGAADVAAVTAAGTHVHGRIEC